MSKAQFVSTDLPDKIFRFPAQMSHGTWCVFLLWCRSPSGDFDDSQSHLLHRHHAESLAKKTVEERWPPPEESRPGVFHPGSRLGLTWLTGLTALIDGHTAPQWIFAVLVSTQGVCIFILQRATFLQLANERVRRRERERRGSESTVSSGLLSHLISRAGQRLSLSLDLDLEQGDGTFTLNRLFRRQRHPSNDLSTLGRTTQTPKERARSLSSLSQASDSVDKETKLTSSTNTLRNAVSESDKTLSLSYGGRARAKRDQKPKAKPSKAHNTSEASFLSGSSSVVSNPGYLSPVEPDDPALKIGSPMSYVSYTDVFSTQDVSPGEYNPKHSSLGTLPGGSDAFLSPEILITDSAIIEDEDESDVDKKTSGEDCIDIMAEQDEPIQLSQKDNRAKWTHNDYTVVEVSRVAETPTFPSDVEKHLEQSDQEDLKSATSLDETTTVSSPDVVPKERAEDHHNETKVAASVENGSEEHRYGGQSEMPNVQNGISPEGSSDHVFVEVQHDDLDKEKNDADISDEEVTYL